MTKFRLMDPFAYGLAILSGVLLGFSFLPIGVLTGLLAFIGLIPLFLALDRSTHFAQSFRILLVGMFFFGLTATWWVGGWSGVGDVDPFLMFGGVMLMVIHPFFLLVPLLLYDITRRRYGQTAAFVLLPIFYAGFELWHALGEVPFPWLSLYNSQTYNTAYIQFIEITGPYALTMLIVIVNILIYRLLFRRTKPKVNRVVLAALLLLFVIPYGYGAVKLSAVHPVGKSITMTIVQPNINPWAKWQSDDQRIMDTNYTATLKAVHAAGDKTELVIWPETAIPFPITTSGQEYFLQQFYRFEDSLKRPILTGFPDMEFYFTGRNMPDDAKPTPTAGVFYRSWNAAMLSFRDTHGHEIERYHKQILVPLGEHIPFIDALPFLGSIFKWSVGLGSWNVGKGYDFFRLPFHQGFTGILDTARISTLICYESIYPSFVREFVNRGAEALVVITNDGWYGNSPGPYQHNQFAVLRAIENRRWTVRCANTGVSSVIDDRGRFVLQTPVFAQTSLTYTVPLNDTKTIYTQYGDFIAIPCMWGSGVFSLYIFVTWVIKRRKKLLDTSKT